MKNVGTFLILTCVLAVVPSYAQGDVTIFGAAQHEGKLNVQTATSTASSLKSFDPATFGTLGLRFSHGKVFGGEHTFGYSPNFIEANTKAVFWNSDVLLQAPLPKVKPYATAGVGTFFTFGT